MNTNRQQMIEELATIQNSVEHQDIMTITAFMDDVQVAAHLARYAAQVAK